MLDQFDRDELHWRADRAAYLRLWWRNLWRFVFEAIVWGLAFVVMGWILWRC